MAAEEETTLVLDEGREAMEKTLESFKQQLLKVRTGRALSLIHI